MQSFNQTCLPQNTSVRTLNSLCPCFQIFDRIFLRMHNQSVKMKQCKRSIFLSFHLARTVCELTSSDTLHSDNFILLTSAKVVLNRRPQNTFSKNNTLCVLLLLTLTLPSLNGSCLVRVCFLGFVHSSSSSSVSCSHLSPTASNPPYWKMANFRKVLMQSRCSLA